ncbi:MAG: cytochrome c [Deltaproteobacteria bacterium]|nr:cytochrome c [Deltaproteobacteria bacterium]
MKILSGYGIILLACLSVFFPSAASGAPAEENYQFYCAQCHGLKGKADGPNAVESQPVSPRDHTSASEMNKLTDEDIINAIEGGGAATSKSVLMPPFGKTLTKAEIAALKDYLRKLCKCKGK